MHPACETTGCLNRGSKKAKEGLQPVEIGGAQSCGSSRRMLSFKVLDMGPGDVVIVLMVNRVEELEILLP